MPLEAGPAVPDAGSLAACATWDRVFGDTPYQDAATAQPTVGGRSIALQTGRGLGGSAVNMMSLSQRDPADYDGWSRRTVRPARHVESSASRTPPSEQIASIMQAAPWASTRLELGPRQSFSRCHEALRSTTDR